MLTAFFKQRAFYLYLIIICFFASGLSAQNVQYPPVQQVAADFKNLLERPKVSLQPKFTSVKTDSVIIERGTICSEKGEKVPVLIYKPVSPGVKVFPVVIFLHGTGGGKDNKDIKSALYQLSKRGIMGVAIDARFHGERIAGGAHGAKEYTDAVTRAWENKEPDKQTHPFLYDTAFDLWRLTDYLVTRPDVIAGRIGMCGISMGGIETWMAASVDSRIKVAVLDISVQCFKWSLDNDRWQGRAATIKAAHLQAAKDMGDTALNKRNVKALWDKVLPGITGEFDCPSMLRLFAPRHLLVLGTENDPNCPLPGAKIAYASAMTAYSKLNATNNLQRDYTPKLFHQTTPEHLKMTLDWFSKWL